MQDVKTNEPFRLVHISDLHLGLEDQSWMWPTFKTALFEDLRGMHVRSGPWDVVVFSGDLTQRGSRGEFDRLKRVLTDLWGWFRTLGSEPQLFVVPGNHDLARPADLDPTGKVMAQWWADAEVRTDFWKSPSSIYRCAVEGWFSNYEHWLTSMPSVVPMLPTFKGLLPGDVSATLEKDSQRVGLVGLNSAWLQHAGGNFMGRLCVDPRQLMAVTGDDPDGWCAKHDFRLLVTHHPVAWLHPSAQENWGGEIHTLRRFDAHLFGHMHEGMSRSEALSGGPIKHAIQAASLFGLEHYGDGQSLRSHGYGVMQLPASSVSRAIRIWPRTLYRRAGGSPRLGADNSWDLIDDSYCDLPTDPGVFMAPSPAPAASADPLHIETAIQDVLERLTRPTTFNEGHAAVRKGEQSVFLAALKEKRQAWLVSDWGLAGNEFLQGVQIELLGRRRPIYYLDLHTYRTQDEMVERLPEHIGCSFARLCAGLAEAGQAMLVLDDVDTDSPSGDSSGAEAGIEQIHGLAKVILDFCPELFVVVRSRLAPGATALQVVELFPLDQADMRLYLAAHPQGGPHLAKPDAVMRLYRHTDGIPAQIDVTLRDMNIVGLKEVFELDTDVAGKHVGNRSVSPGLVRAIKELSEAPDDVSARSFALLKVLSMFPQGEQLSRVKRFFGTKAFYPVHASRLIDLGFVDPVAVTSLGENSSEHDQGRALVVRRPVRECVIRSLTDAEHRTLSAKALSLYFGDDWELRGIRPATDLRFKDSRCEAREIGNACTMVLRATRAAVESGAASRVKSVLTLATAFVAQLRTGDHYRSIASLYDDLLPLHERSGLALNLDLARLQHAQALRMVDESARAWEQLKRCEASVTAKAMKQQVLLTMALVAESLRMDSAEICEIAKRAEQIVPKSNIGLQAKAIAISHDDSNKGDRDSQLLKLQEEAVKRKAYVVSNNLALDRAAKVKEPQRKKRILEAVVQTARRENEAYNFIRALLELAKLTLNESGVLREDEMLDCTRAYTYLFNQRMDSLFNKCHDVLWRAFKASGDVGNMLKLFRYSSLVWRLKGQVGLEKRYIAELLPQLGQGSSARVLTADRKLVYFMTRSLELSAETTQPALPASTK